MVPSHYRQVAHLRESYWFNVQYIADRVGAGKNFIKDARNLWCAARYVLSAVGAHKLELRNGSRGEPLVLFSWRQFQAPVESVALLRGRALVTVSYGDVVRTYTSKPLVVERLRASGTHGVVVSFPGLDIPVTEVESVVELLRRPVIVVRERHEYSAGVSRNPALEPGTVGDLVATDANTPMPRLTRHVLRGATRGIAIPGAPPWDAARGLNDGAYEVLGHRGYLEYNATSFKDESVPCP